MDGSRVKRDEDDVVSIINTIDTMVNPFDEERKELLQLASGVVATEQTSKDMHSLWVTGKRKAEEFVNSKILTEEPDIFSPIKTTKLRTFTNMHNKMHTKNSKGELIAIKNTKNLFAKLILLAKSRDVDMKEVLKYPLRPHPLPFATADGKLVKTMKSKLLQILEEAVEDPLVTSIVGGGALLVDAMALLQTLQVKIKSFGELAEDILKQIIILSNTYGCQRVDFIGDRYPNPSIKDLERAKRAIGGTALIRIVNERQPVPRQWKKFLSNGENKEEIMKFLFTHWSSLDRSHFSNKSVYLTHERKCHQFVLSTDGVVVREVESLESDHEEADTRLIAHCYHAALLSYGNVVIRSPDTDVFVIALSAIHQFTADVFFATGNQNKKRIIHVNKVADHWGRTFVDAVLGFHSFTGINVDLATLGVLILSCKNFCDLFLRNSEN